MDMAKYITVLVRFSLDNLMKELQMGKEFIYGPMVLITVGYCKITKPVIKMVSINVRVLNTVAL
jgi:hypothetical protein